ncbi:MAG: hypothetical protein HYX76_01405 [Acidobacteria bacterium]|nr:hypothetical protein [Acidobacteriota bacterium]
MTFTRCGAPRASSIHRVALAILLSFVACSASPIKPTPPVRIEPPAPPQPPPPSAPKTSVTNFLAFGDSLTEGVTALDAPPFALISAQSYPFKLQVKLTERYSLQTITVANEGRGGELAEQGVNRLPGLLKQHSPEAVLLLEGVNDLNLYGAAGAERTLGHLEQMARTSRLQGLQVLIGTLPPQREGGQRAGTYPLIVPFNTALKDMARREGLTVVDLYEGFAGDLALIGADGLHPNEAGYERMAQIFFDAITTKFETTSATRR